MKKRAVELSIQTIIVAAIALIVLVIVILIFRGQIGKTSQRYTQIGEQVSAEANATDKCETLFSDQKCMKSCAPVEIKDKKNTVVKTIYYMEVAGPKKWQDCPSGRPKCCKPV